MHILVHPMFCKVCTGPRVAQLSQPKRAWNPTKATKQEQQSSYEIITQRYAKCSSVRCWRSKCCISSFPGDSDSTTPKLSSISHRSVIKGQRGGEEEKQTPQDSSESLCWEVRLCQINQLWKLCLLSQRWNPFPSLPAWTRLGYEKIIKR